MAQNFRAGQASYNQFIRNVGRIQGLIEEQKNLLAKTTEDYHTLEALTHRLTTHPQSLHRSEMQKMANIQARLAVNAPRYTQLNRNILQLKRRILNVVGPRFRPPAYIRPPYNHLVLMNWKPNRLVAAMKLSAANKIRRAALRHVEHPNRGGKKLMRNMALSGLFGSPPRTVFRHHS